jgi:hypothetical protein
MQLIYAAPFILLSLASFFVCLLMPRLRPYAFRALVVPVAFGFCSIVGMVLIGVSLNSINKNPLFNKPITDAQTCILAALMYFPPGLLGAWIAVHILRRIENRLLSTDGSRAFAVRSTVALIVFPPSFILCLGVSNRLLGSDWAISHLALSLPLAAMVAVFAAVLAYRVN